MPTEPQGSESPLKRIWSRVKDQAPRQKAIAATTASVRRRKPRSTAKARTMLVDEAAKHGVTDLSDKELQLMVDGVLTSAKDATTAAVSKGAATVRSMWASLQHSTPEWLELPDSVAALPMRSDQRPVDIAIVVTAPELVTRLHEDVELDRTGSRAFDCWLDVDATTAEVVVHVGAERLGTVPDPQAGYVRETLGRRRGWTPAAVVGEEPATATVTVELPDRA